MTTFYGITIEPEPTGSEKQKSLTKAINRRLEKSGGSTQFSRVDLAHVALAMVEGECSVTQTLMALGNSKIASNELSIPEYFDSVLKDRSNVDLAQVDGLLPDEIRCRSCLLSKHSYEMSMREFSGTYDGDLRPEINRADELSLALLKVAQGREAGNDLEAATELSSLITEHQKQINAEFDYANQMAERESENSELNDDQLRNAPLLPDDSPRKSSGLLPLPTPFADLDYVTKALGAPLLPKESDHGPSL